MSNLDGALFNMRITIKNLFLFQALGILIFSIKKTYDMMTNQMKNNSLGNKPPLYKSEYKFFSSNNLKCLYIRNMKLKKSYVSMGVYCGSQYDTIPGLAHLLEHLLFISPEENTLKERNSFDSFLNKYNGESNAFTSDDMTVYHYELDTVGLPESLKMFANFFKNPLIEEFTIESEIKNVDSEFQMGKNHDDYRIWRMQEILAGEEFSTGNFNTLGTNYLKLKQELNHIYKKYYKKMAFVIITNLDFEAIKDLTQKHFSLPLTEIQYKNRKCIYCETVKEPENQSFLKLDNLVRLKGVSSKKCIQIIIPLVSEYNLPFNIYEPLSYFLGKYGHESYDANLKRKNLAISVSSYIVPRAERDILLIDLTVEDTCKYELILQLTRKYFRKYLTDHKTLFEECQRKSKIEWEKKEDPDPRSHVIECIEQMLRSETLFTSNIFQHDCPNMTFNKCSVILVDKNFNITEKRDEYELQYEELPIKEQLEDLVDVDWNKIEKLHPDQTELIKDDVNESELKTLCYKNSKLVIVSDKFDITDTVIELFMKSDCSLNDRLNFKIFYENIKYVYADLLKMNGISFKGSATCRGITFKITGRDPLFLLTLILTKAKLNLLDPKLIAKDMYNKKIKQKHKHGHLRVSEEIQSIYLDHILDLDSEISHLKAILDHQDFPKSTSSFFDGITRIDMVISGAHNVETYYNCFKKMVCSLETDRPDKDLAIVSQYSKNIPLRKIDESNGQLLSDSIIRASKTIRAKNKATALFFRIGKGVRSAAITRIMVNSLRENFFNQLRTEKGLGYVVNVSHYKMKGEFFVSFRVQSKEDVLQQIIEFINQSEFTLGNIQSIINEILTQKLRRKDLVDLYSTILTDGLEHKNLEKPFCNELKSITPEHLKQALKTAEISLIQSLEFE